LRRYTKVVDASVGGGVAQQIAAFRGGLGDILPAAALGAGAYTRSHFSST
jgi:hypothetical protein